MSEKVNCRFDIACRHCQPTYKGFALLDEYTRIKTKEKENEKRVGMGRS